MFIGMMIGIAQSNPSNSGLYGVTVVYLITISDVFQWIMRQMILVESLMVSAERILQFDHFEQEK
jgi:Na+-translocating ferredoxin:NAD+ oxidoreductase RnfA subunit